jgi:hypothetical protein
VHDALDRAVGVIPDRIGRFLRGAVELGRIGNELRRDRVMPIGRIDERRQVRRQRDGIARGHPFELGEPLGRRQPGRHKIRGAAQGRGRSCSRSHLAIPLLEALV